jgi:hypothetical protein
MNEDEDGDMHEHCNKCGKFVDNFAGHRYVLWNDSRQQYGSENIDDNVECYELLLIMNLHIWLRGDRDMHANTRLPEIVFRPCIDMERRKENINVVSI